jgi:predicted dehydrogenase
MTLRAVIIGAGWAGEGHTIGLRDAGVTVMAICGRTPEPAYARAHQLAIANVRFDWRAALEEFRPDIVSIATPGDMHRVIAEHAAMLGCHIVCEKPLATTAADARAMLAAVEQAGVQHAYAATGCYAPAILHAEALVTQGVIGLVREIESYERFVLPPTMPYSWAFDNPHGGGLLANIFTHKLAQVLRVTGGRPIASAGVATMKTRRMPIAPIVHDFRQLFGPIEGWEPSQATEWHEATSDVASMVVVDLRMPQGHTARATFQLSVGGIGPYAPQLVLFGDGGTLAMGSGYHDALVRRYHPARAAWEDLPLPERLMMTLPAVEDPVQRAWNQLFRTFVAALRGSGSGDFLTFRDGRVALDIIEMALAGHGWSALPDD